MRTPPDADGAAAAFASRRCARTGWARRRLPSVAVACALLAAVQAATLAQISFEQSVKDLASPDAGTRLKTVRMLKAAAYPEAAVPLAPLVGDAQDQIQLEAIAAELNIFLAERVVPSRRVGLVLEVRNAVSAAAAFAAGPSALAPRPVPMEVLTALRAAVHDDNPRVGVEALYAFGTLAVGPRGGERAQLVRASGPDLVALVGAPDPAMRFAALQVIGRVLARRAGDERIDEHVGDGVITALNDRDRAVTVAAMQALGAMRYDRAVTALGQLFAFHAKGDLAAATLDALARIAHPASATLLATQLTSKTAALRGIAVEGLARIGERGRLADIQTALKSERVETVLLASDFAATMLSGAPVDPIAEALVRTRLRDQARGYLAEIAPGRTGLFTRQLQDPDARIRGDVVEALGLSDDAAAIPLVEPLASDADPLIARAAAVAAARLRAAASP
jgi:HEAT repeat protein